MNISKWRSTDEAKWRETKTKRGKSKAFTIWGKINKKKKKEENQKSCLDMQLKTGSADKISIDK